MQEGDELVLRFRIGKSPIPPAVRIRRLLKIAGRQLQLEDAGTKTGDFPAEADEPIPQNSTEPKGVSRSPISGTS